jgi:hypothetical protein
MPTRKSNPNAGISRIDQNEKRTHGFFVRLSRKGKVYSAFFADKSHGGKTKALKAARTHYQGLLHKHGRISRRDWAEMVRRKSPSGIVGVRRVTAWRGNRKHFYWMATWSPRRHEVQRRMFSVKKYGPTKAKELALKARRTGLKSMED